MLMVHKVVDISGPNITPKALLKEYLTVLMNKLLITHKKYPSFDKEKFVREAKLSNANLHFCRVHHGYVVHMRMLLRFYVYLLGDFNRITTRTRVIRLSEYSPHRTATS